MIEKYKFIHKIMKGNIICWWGWLEYMQARVSQGRGEKNWEDITHCRFSKYMEKKEEKIESKQTRSRHEKE